MKKILITFLTTLYFTLLSTAQIGLHSTGIGISWYKPSLDYWNNKSSISDWENRFDGSLAYDFNLKILLLPKLKGNFAVGFWEETISQNNIKTGWGFGRQELSIRLLPISGSLSFDIYKRDSLSFNFYIGIGGSLNFIQKTFSHFPNEFPPTFDIDNGRDYTAFLLGGIEKKIFHRFTIGLEGKYHLGNYIQQVQEVSGKINREKVSLSGFQILVTLNYLLKPSPKNTRDENDIIY